MGILRFIFFVSIGAIIGHLISGFLRGLLGNSKGTAASVGLGIILIIIAIGLKAKADTYYSFKFKTKDELKISVPAASYEEAYKKATMQCYQLLTKGVYPGEENGLLIIDTCANPEVK